MTKPFRPCSGDPHPPPLPPFSHQVVFEYTAYNENGGRIDSTLKQGRPARTRIGIQGMIPGFEEGIKSMRRGGKRRG